MNSWNLSKVVALVLLLASSALLAGILFGVHVWGHFEEIIPLYSHHGELQEAFRETALYSMISGSLLVLGIGMLVLLSMHMLRRSTRIQREAEILRKKNQAMEELNRKTRQLAHHQRLEIIGTLTSSIAHEFNNLLTPIMGYSMMALEKLPPEEEELYDDLLEIYNASRKAKTIISRLSDLSRKNTAVTFRPVSLDELVKKTLDVANPARPLKTEIKLNLNCWDQRLLANEIQMSQLLLNLILNGFHAIGEKPGVMTIETSFDEHNIHLRISDNGCGIPEDIRKKIFEPFFTTKEAGKGTGLGLAIVAQVVADHHGHIRVDSAVGEGTQISISLPRNQDPVTLE